MSQTLGMYMGVATAGSTASASLAHSPAGFLVAFGAGIVSFLSPCVLPLVPSYLSMMSGVGLDAGRDVASRARVLRSTVLFVAGFTVIFVLLEATASAASAPLRQHKAVLDYVAGALIIVMGLFVAGIVRIPWLQGERRIDVRPSKLGPWAAPVMGMTFAFGWTPCITPVLASVLGLASSGGTLARGEGMLVAYSLGLGVPFIVTGMAFARLSGALTVARRHARSISIVAGLVLAALGVLMVAQEVSVVSSWSQSVLQRLGLGSL